MSYSARAARRSYDLLLLERANEAAARKLAAEQDQAADEERQVRAVEAEFIHAREADERLALLIQAVKAEFDRAGGHTSRFGGLKRSHVHRVVAVVNRAYELVDRLYVRHEAGDVLRGGEWQDAFAELARIRAKLSAVEAEIRRSR